MKSMKFISATIPSRAIIRNAKTNGQTAAINSRIFPLASLLLLSLSFTVAGADANNNNNNTSAVILPQPTGQYVTGVHDIEFTDTVYPTTNRPNDDNGRRLMARVRYPACLKTNFDATTSICSRGNTVNEISRSSSSSSSLSQPFGRRRMLFEEDEFDALLRPLIDSSIGQYFDLGIAASTIKNSMTYSYMDAPPLLAAIDEKEISFPILIYSHGGLSYVSENTPLMEEFASRGYIVFSIAHPDGSAGIKYPSNGDIVRYDDQFLMDVLALTMVGDERLISNNITDRYYARQELNDSTGLPTYLPRWTYDMIALVDYLESSQSKTDYQLLTTLLQGEKDDEGITDLSGRFVYGGTSFGGAAAGSAAQIDDRSMGGWNLDGTHLSNDLFDIKMRVPYMTFVAELNGRLPSSSSSTGYSNEFMFEPLETMGHDNNIIRIQMDNYSHFELIDLKFAPIETRSNFLGGGIRDSVDLHSALVEFTIGFTDSILKTTNDDDGGGGGGSGSNWTKEDAMTRIPDAYVVDVSYIAEWWEAEIMDDDNDDELDSAATKSSGSATVKVLVVVVVGAIFSSVVGWV